MSSHGRVFLVLATCQGEAYLPAQLASLRQQSFADWTLLIRDDDSTDRTPEILQAAAAADRRIQILRDNSGRLGVTANFGCLLTAAHERGAEAVLCCDQDDVWFPTKVERQLEHLQAVAMVHPSATPLLCHADLEVVDAELQTVHPSFTARLGGYPPERELHRRLLTGNHVTGCTMIVNRPLLELALPIPPAAVLHDWWLAMCAGYGGRICYLSERLLKYRQHAGNVVGSNSRWQRAFGWLPQGSRKLRRFQKNLRGSVHQAWELRNRLRGSARFQPLLHAVNAGFLSPRALLDAYIAMATQTPAGWTRWQRLRRLLTNPGNRTSWQRAREELVTGMLAWMNFSELTPNPAPASAFEIGSAPDEDARQSAAPAICNNAETFPGEQRTAA